MEKAIIREIKENILDNNPATFVKGYSTLRQLKNGTVVQWVSDEGTPVGLTDNKYNYFYIRYKDEPKISEPDDRTTSCQEYQNEVDLRLLAWVNKGNEAKLEEVLLHDLANVTYGLSETEQRQVSKISPLRVTEIIKNRERIYAEETLKEDKAPQLIKGVTLLAIDFTLKFNHKIIQHDGCLDRTICEQCA